MCNYPCDNCDKQRYYNRILDFFPITIFSTGSSLLEDLSKLNKIAITKVVISLSPFHVVGCNRLFKIFFLGVSWFSY